MKKFTLFLLVLSFTGTTIQSLSQQRGEDPSLLQEKANSEQLAREFQQKFEQQKAEAVRLAIENGWPVRLETDDGRLIDIQYIDPYTGMPQYYTTTNLNAARTTNTDDLWTGGSSGLNLTGAGYLVGEWDGGGVLTTHQEFNEGGVGRVTQMDSPASTHYHSTHVAGTIIAEGQVNAAHGMASAALLNAYDWDNDNSEMTSAASAGLTLSNHSYGWSRGWSYNSGYWYWHGDVTISTTEDYLFGFYDVTSRDWDIIAYNYPGYLVVKSAGNHRNDNYTGGHYYWNGSSWTWSTAYREPDGGSDGYDCIGQRGIAKNILTVGAVHDITGGWTSPSSVVMSDFSSWGPTDDGRIKPDIVANGVDLYSTTNTGNSSYLTIGGTSMSAPNVTGTLVLLQDYYKSLRTGTMSAAAIKGLVINTANEAGTADGPDYRFGWGLLNATGAAGLITNDNTQGGLIVQGVLVNGQTTDYTYYSSGSDINVTLCWTDPAGTPSAPSLNPTALKLVNNLNLRLVSGTTNYYPWILNPSSPASNATKGVNSRDNVETVNIKSPAPGYYTIRISHGGTLTNSQQAYALIVNGLSVPPTQTYCVARSTFFNTWEYIQKVQIGSINNTSGRSPGGYSDYRGLVTQISKGGSASITVTLGNPWSGDVGEAWVDWNQNGVFETSEKFSLGSGVGPYSATITAPASAFGGYTTMRVRMFDTYSNPCGTLTYGETEDYTIKVSGSPGLWTGTVSTDWNNPLNWDDGAVPGTAVNVTIPSGTPYSPVILSGNAYCNNLMVNSGATLVQNSTSYFYVYGHFDPAFGQFTMNGTTSYLYFSGTTNNYWYNDLGNDIYTQVRVAKSSPTAQTYMYSDMTCSGNFRIDGGILEMAPNKTLTVNNTTTSAFQVMSGGTLNLATGKSLTVAGGIIFQDGSQANIAGGTIICGSNFRVNSNTSYNIALTGATLNLNGSATQYIQDLDGGNLQLHHLTISKSAGTVYIANANLDVNGNLLITSGTLSCNNAPTPTATYNIKIAGNWTNSAFPTGFVPGSGRVIFNGPGHQYVYSSENFNILEANMVAALRVNNAAYIVTCNQYDWTTGAIDVIAGTFTALDLFDEGLYGGFYVNPSGTLNITNSTSTQWVDLNGEIHIFGGTMNVTGIVCDFAYGGNALIEMSGGVLDFKTCGIGIHNTGYTLTSNITGGIIRTAYGFYSSRADFTPSAGTFEFYGSNDVTISLSNGSTLYDVVINKSSKGDDELMSSELSAEGRDGLMLSSEGKANNVSLGTNFTVTGDLKIQAGSLTMNGKQMTILDLCDVYGTLNMNDPNDKLFVGNASYDNLSFYTGSVGNLNAGEMYLASWIVPNSGSFVIATTNHTIFFTGNALSGGLSNHDPGTLYGNVVVDKSAERIYIDGLATEPVVLAGSLTVNSGNIVEMQYGQMHVQGTLIDFATSAIYVYNAKSTDKGDVIISSIGDQTAGINAAKLASLEIDNYFIINGLMDVGDGSVLSHDGFQIAGTGTLNISSGSFVMDASYYKSAKAWQYIYGTLNLSSGLFEISHNSINLHSTAVTNVSGGIIRCGFSFISVTSGVFTPTGGLVEFTGADVSPFIHCSSGNWFNNLFINRTAGIVISSDIIVKGNLEIISGPLLTYDYSGQHNMLIGGNWTNNGGVTAFDAGTGMVTFQSTGSVQDVFGNSNFCNVTHLYTSAMNYLRFQDANTIQNNLVLNHFCWAYDQLYINGTLNINNPASKFTANGTGAVATIGILDQGGTIICNSGATIQVNDLLEGGLYGNITLESGTFNIHQDAQFIDLNGNLTIESGVMNIYGSYGGSSIWPYTNNASITMSGGVLDIKDLGVYVSPTYILAVTITGGTIRTVGHFEVARTDFTPAGGTIELYGGTDAWVRTASGSHFYNLFINKSGGAKGFVKEKSGDESNMADLQKAMPALSGIQDAGPGKRPVTPELLSEANQVHNADVLKVNNTTTVDEGAFFLTQYPVTCMGNIAVNSGGTLKLSENSLLAIESGKSLTINGGGILDVFGTNAGPATITHNTGYYALNVESGGTIGAVYGIFEYTNTSGVNIKSGALVDVAKPFNNCTFRLGQSGGRLMTIQNNQSFNVENAVFPTNTWGGAYNVYKSVNVGMVYFVSATGGFAGELYDYDPNNRIVWTNRMISMKAYLEGPFSGSGMSTTLNPILPLNHPFNPALPYFGNPLPDWYYTGAGSVGAIPNNNIVDWVLVDVRDAVSAASATPATSVARIPAFILNNGNIVGLNGSSNLELPVVITNNLFVALYHRNHIGILNANGMPYSSGMYSYDYTTGSSQVYGGTNAHKQLASGVWGMMSGDGDGTGTVQTADKTNVWSIQAGTAGYKAGDYNMNRQVNNPDKDDKWLPNLGKGSYIPE